MSDQTAEHEPLSRPATAGVLVGVYVALLYVVELVDTVTSGGLEQNGVRPRDLGRV